MVPGKVVIAFSMADESEELGRHRGNWRIEVMRRGCISGEVLS